MAQVELIQLTKRYKEATAVNQVSLTIQDKEFLVLLGPSGCGKSTILKMIAGLEPITDGEIYIDDQLVNYKAPKERNVAMVFQNYALYPHMRVEENIGFPLKMGGNRPETIKEKVAQVARTLRLDPFLARLPAQLSGGQRQRVALGRATIRNPAVFLMDEPLSNLDAMLRVQMRDELLKLHERLQTTMIYVTHDQVEAMTMGQRIVVMRDGVVQQVGPPQQVYDQPVNEFVASFLGSPRINLLSGTMTQEKGVWRFQKPGFTLALGAEMQQRLAGVTLKSDDPITLGVRPEDLEIVPAQADGDLQGTVHLIEPVGSDKYVSVRLGEEECMVRTSPRLPLQKGEAVGIRLAWPRVHLFDSSGRNVFTNTA
jgi:multiple sugar transport system ATP-binding protein